MDLITFDPTVDQLNKMIAVTSAITAEDLSDDKQISVVKEYRIKLRDVRILIKKQGKDQREEALEHQKKVIAYENELLSIIGPEEDRLKELEDQAAQIKVRAARQALLPMRKEQLEGLVFGMDREIEDEFLLDMDNDEFITYLNIKKVEKFDRDMAEVKAREAVIADKERIAQVEEAARVAERNRIEAKVEAEKKAALYIALQKELEAKKEADMIVQEAREEAAKVRVQEEAKLREQAIKERQEIEEKARRERQLKYQEWLTRIGYTETEHGSWYFDTKDDVTNAYKLISSFKNV